MREGESSSERGCVRATEREIQVARSLTPLLRFTFAVVISRPESAIEIRRVEIRKARIWP